MVANDQAQPTLQAVSWSEKLGDSLHRELGHAKLFASLLGVPQVILGLLVKPALSRRAERHGQANGHFRTDARA